MSSICKTDVSDSDSSDLLAIINSESDPASETNEEQNKQNDSLSESDA